MCKAKIVLIFSFFSLSSYASTFWSELEYRWSSVKSIKVSDYVTAGEPVRNPVGVSIPLASTIILNRDFHHSKDCLIYKTPSKSAQGELKLVNISPDESCEKVLTGHAPVLIVSNLYNLAIKLEDRSMTIVNDKTQFKIKFFNMLQKRNKSILETSASNTLIPGLKISTIITKKSQSLKSGDLCFDVDDKCNDVLENRCDQCPGGIVPVIASSCKSKVRKYCLSGSCGKSGGPACIRGFKTTGYTGPYCINDSPVAYCVKPYRVICINEELVCR